MEKKLEVEHPPHETLVTKIKVEEIMSSKITSTYVSRRVKKIIGEELPSESNVKEIQMLSGMLDSAVNEMREFSKRKPDESLNPTKIRILNRLLNPIKNILSIEPSGAYLDILNEEDIPSNSDCVLILGQYQASISHYRGKFFGYDGSTNRWFTKENPGQAMSEW